MTNKYYTGKGDAGDTGFFGTADRFPKSSLRVEALGTVDELGSWVGLCKAKVQSEKVKVILEAVQQHLFTIQAEIGGADVHLKAEHIKNIEEEISRISTTLPKITEFKLSGASELCAMLDVTRTVARRAERRIVALAKDTQVMGASQGRPREHTLSYLNRISTLFYVLARQEAVKCGIMEKSPEYK